MVVVSCSGKFHAFALAEQLERHRMLTALYTVYASQRNPRMQRFAKRFDTEAIPPEKIRTMLPLAVALRLAPQLAPTWAALYDHRVAMSVHRERGARAFIGWSSISLEAIRVAKRLGMLTIVERGSSHIRTQDRILREEHARFGRDFRIPQQVIDREVAEYAEADFISIPSSFVRRSFLEQGVSEAKLIQNPYGVGKAFRRVPSTEPSRPFRVLYLGSLTIQKGLIYLFRALELLGRDVECWFVGAISDELRSTVEAHRRPGWRFFGHVQAADLPRHLSECDVAVQPSLQEGLSMVIPQMLACGLPVIATTNTGGEDVIDEGVTGYVVPIRDPEAIAERLRRLYDDRALLQQMSTAAASQGSDRLTWARYGDRYANFLRAKLG